MKLGKDIEYETKEVDTMNASVIKPSTPFVCTGELKSTPIPDSIKEMQNFIRTHNFSFSIDKSKSLVTEVTKKETENGNL